MSSSSMLSRTITAASTVAPVVGVASIQQAEGLEAKETTRERARFSSRLAARAATPGPGSGRLDNRRVSVGGSHRAIAALCCSVGERRRAELKGVHEHFADGSPAVGRQGDCLAGVESGLDRGGCFERGSDWKRGSRSCSRSHRAAGSLMVVGWRSMPANVATPVICAPQGSLGAEHMQLRSS